MLLTDCKTVACQIVIVSDGGPNTFVGMYYDKIEWTTGDDSSGTNSAGVKSNAYNGWLCVCRTAFMPWIFFLVLVLFV